MIERCRGALLVAAAAYLALLPTGALSFWRSFAFAAGALTAGILIAAGARGRAPAIPLPGAAVPASALAWSLWACASLAWSVEPGFTAGEVKADVLWGLVTAVIFYVAAVAVPRGAALLAATMAAAFAFWTALAAGMAFAPGGFDARPFHRGEGAFATYLVTSAPFLAFLCWPRSRGPRAWIAAVVLLVLLVVTTRLSDNRIAWIALAASAIVLAALAPDGSRVRRLSGVAALVVVFALLFADAAQDRAVKVRPADGSVAGALAEDPRPAIWRIARERIGERPWLGYGYGQHILGARFGTESGDAKVMHAHNLLVSQWLQTGAIGVALLVAMLASVAMRFGGYVASRDVELARIGAVGLAVLAGFALRNLTDDFFIRANARLLFAALAILLGAGTARQQELAATT